MTDEAKALVERLRWGAWYYEDPFDGKAYASDDPLEAADLIETQAREIERLRVALEKIASQKLAGEMEADVWAIADFDDAYDLCIYEARAALKENTDASSN